MVPGNENYFCAEEIWQGLSAAQSVSGGSISIENDNSMNLEKEER
jgi:hypothetical protein